MRAFNDAELREAKRLARMYRVVSLRLDKAIVEHRQAMKRKRG